MSNLGSLDRLARLMVGAALVLAPFLTSWPLWTNVLTLWAALIVGVVLVATSAFGFCPIYAALGLSSKRKDAV